MFIFQIFFSMTKKYFFSKFYFPKRSSCVLSIPLLFIPIRPKHHYKKLVEKKFFFDHFFDGFCLNRSGSKDHAVTKPIKNSTTSKLDSLDIFRKKNYQDRITELGDRSNQTLPLSWGVPPCDILRSLKI